MKLTIRSTKELNKLRVSMACMGNQDARYYLNGVMFQFFKDSTDVRVVGTDGHRMAADIIHMDEDHPDDYSRPGWWTEGEEKCGELVVGIAKKDKIPKRADRVEILFLDRQSPGTMSCYSGVDVLKVIPITVVDGSFPDWQRIIPKAGDIAVRSIGIDTRLLNEIAMAPTGLKWTQARLEFSHEVEGALTVIIPGYSGDDTVIVLMPCRI